jgi:hypothetical protein
VRLGDALHDRETQADTYLRIVDALGATLERLGKHGNELGVEPFAGVLHGQDHTGSLNAGSDADGSVLGQVVDDGIVYEVRSQLQ